MLATAHYSRLRAYGILTHEKGVIFAEKAQNKKDYKLFSFYPANFGAFL